MVRSEDRTNTVFVASHCYFVSAASKTRGRDLFFRWTAGMPECLLSEFDMNGTKLWLWQYTDEFGKQRVTRYRLSEEEARKRLRDPVKVEGTLEIRKPIESTKDFLKSQQKS